MPKPLDARRAGLAWAFASAIGSAFFVIPWKMANEIGDPGNSVLILLSTAALLNTLLVAIQHARSSTIRFDVRRIEIVVALMLAGFTLFGNLASAFAIQELSPALLNVMLRSEVIWVALFAWLFLGERVDARFWIGVAIATYGLFLLQGPLDLAHLLASFGPGTGMALAAAACFGSLAVITRRFIDRIDPVIVNALRLWMAVALWFPFHPFPDFNAIPASQIGYAAMSAIVGPFLGRLFMMISARYVEARITTLTILTAPVMTVALVFLVLGDVPQTYEVVGGLIMMAGIAVPLLRPARAPAAAG